MNFTPLSLGEQQNQLLAQILSPQTNSPSRGLAAYRANGQTNAKRALEATHPVIAQMLGDENFAYLARDFWREFPPQCGDLAQWGGRLASFLTHAHQLADMPFLADVARIEWALHVCAGAEDTAQDGASFSALTEHEPDTLSLTLAPGTWALASAYPAAAMVLAHTGQLDQGVLDAAFDLLRQGVGQTALVWRDGFAPRLRVVHVHEHAFARAVVAGQTLAEALDCAPVDFDFSSWLAENVRNGLLMGVAVSGPQWGA